MMSPAEELALETSKNKLKEGIVLPTTRTNGKVNDKEVLKHATRMQERLSKHKEADEKKKREEEEKEEEEKLRREEEEKKREAAAEAVFPCVLKIRPSRIFNNMDPIVLGVDVVAGIAKVGTPICIPRKDFIDIGRIASIQSNHKLVDFAKEGQYVSIKIVGSNSEEQQMKFGWHFGIMDELVSHISRASIDSLEAYHLETVSKEELNLLVKLKYMFNIQ